MNYKGDDYIIVINREANTVFFEFNRESIDLNEISMEEILDTMDMLGDQLRIGTIH